MSPYFSVVLLVTLFVAVDDSALRQVVWRHFDFHFVALENSYVVYTQLSAELRQYFMAVCEHHSKLSFRQDFDDFAFGFDNVFF